MMTDKDREAAEKFADEIGARPFGGEAEKLYHYEHRGRENGFIAGIAHERKRSEKLVEALRKIDWEAEGFAGRIAADALREYEKG